MLLLLISLTGHAQLPEQNIQTGNAPEALLEQSRQLQMEATRLLFDFYLDEQSLLFPEYDLVSLQFNQEVGASIILQRLELFLDGVKVKELRYSGGDVLNLMDGAHQRLYATLLSAGTHRIRVRLHGIGYRHGPYIEGEYQFEKYAMPVRLQMRILGSELVFEQW